MKFIVNFAKNIKNNPKKSIAGGVVSYFIYKWLNGKYCDSLFRREHCRRAQYYGQETIGTLQEPKRITVFLNPAANGGKASDMFYKNAAPVLHLAGLEVHVVRLDYEGQAKQLLAVLDKTDMIVAAGGDGTLNEVVTGLLRKDDGKHWKNTPIAVIPLGKNNAICRNLCNENKSERQAQWVCDAAFDIIDAVTKPVDVMKVEADSGKTVYCLSDIRWGIYRDVCAKVDAGKYWYWFGLKHYASFVFAWLRQSSFKLREFSLSYVGPEKIEYIETQEITSNQNTTESLLSRIVRRLIPWMFSSNQQEIIVEEVDEIHEEEEPVIWDAGKEFESYEVLASANRCKDPQRDEAYIEIHTEEPHVNFTNFVSKGPFVLHHGAYNGINSQDSLKVSKFKFSPKYLPEVREKKTIQYFSIDNEAYEVMPISVEILPNYINLVCSKNTLIS